MTVEEILQALEQIHEKLVVIKQSHAYQAIIAHPEYIAEEVTLTDCRQGIEEALETIHFISGLSKNE